MTDRGFTMLDVMITVTILGILAAVIVPVVSKHRDMTETAAAESQLDMVRKALDLYYQRNGTWPGTIEPQFFVGAEPVTMPRGYQLEYTAGSGELELVALAPDEIDGADPIKYIE